MASGVAAVVPSAVLPIACSSSSLHEDSACWCCQLRWERNLPAAGGRPPEAAAAPFEAHMPGMHELSSLLWHCRFDPLGLSDPEGAGGFVNPEWLRCVCSCTRTTHSHIGATDSLSLILWVGLPDLAVMGGPK